MNDVKIIIFLGADVKIIIFLGARTTFLSFVDPDFVLPPETHQREETQTTLEEVLSYRYRTT